MTFDDFMEFDLDLDIESIEDLASSDFQLDQHLDLDGDGIADDLEMGGPDLDGDGIGDFDDVFIDLDENHIADTSALQDLDGDGIPNLLDESPDIDGDGV